MPSPNGSTATGSRSSYPIQPSSNTTTMKSGRGAINKWSSIYNPDLPSSLHFRVQQQPYPHTGAPSSYVDAATRNLDEVPFTSDLDSTLLNLPLYDGELYKRFGHEVYVRAEKSGGEPPTHYMPPPYFWHNHANAIRRIVLTDELVRRMWTIRHGDNAEYQKIFKLFIEGAGKHMKHHWVYYGVDVNISLPSSEDASPCLDACHIMYAALSIELCRYAIGKPAKLAHNIIELVRYITKGTGAGSVTTMATNSSNRAYSMVCEDFDTQLLVEYKKKMQAKLLQVQLEKEQALRMAKFEKEQQLRARRARKASKELWHQHYLRDSAAFIIKRWYYCYKLRRTINHRIMQRTITNNKRAKLHSICIGASIYANNIKASRPPRDSSMSNNTATAPKPNPTTHTHPFRHRGLPLNKKRKQTNRHRDRRTRQKKSRPRNRPPRKFRTGPSSTPMVSILPSCLLDSITEDTTTTASSDLSVPSTDESDSLVPTESDSVYHPTNNDEQPILPLCFWAAQTSAAIITLNIGNNDLLVKPTPSPTKAASTIQNMYRHYRTHRRSRAASTLQYLDHINNVTTITTSPPTENDTNNNEVIIIEDTDIEVTDIKGDTRRQWNMEHSIRNAEERLSRNLVTLEASLGASIGAQIEAAMNKFWK